MLNQNGLYQSSHMAPAEDPVLQEIRRKQAEGAQLSLGEQLRAGRDDTVKQIGDILLRPDHVYRAVGKDALDAYTAAGSVISQGEGKGSEYVEGDGNGGVDWYLGAVARKYGEHVIEAPADPDYFVPADQNGHAMAKDPTVRHMKSSGRANPVPMDRVRIIPLS